MVERRTRPGGKGRGDEVLEIRTDGWETITFEDLLRCLEFMFENEDRIYSKALGFQGRGMLVEAVNRVAEGESVARVLMDLRLAPLEAGLQDFVGGR